MALRIIQYSQVREVTAEGMTYEIDNLSYYLDFDICYQNYLKWRLMSRENFELWNPEKSYDEYLERRKERLVIGKRNVEGEAYGDIPKGMPWIEFEVLPPLVLRFADKGEFSRFRHEDLRKGDWVTIDMT